MRDRPHLQALGPYWTHSLEIFKLGQFKGGLICERKENREKPFHLLAKRTIGYEREGIKPIGIEGAYNQILKGKNGKKLVQKFLKKC